MKAMKLGIVLILTIISAQSCKESGKTDSNNHITTNSMKKIIASEMAPEAVGPYSQAVEINGFLYVSGQLPIDKVTGEFVPGGIKEQTEQSLKNVSYILEKAGYSFDDVLKSTVYLDDIADFAAMNEVYARFFKEPYPARVAYSVSALPKGALVEIDVIAAKQR